MQQFLDSWTLFLCHSEYFYALLFHTVQTPDNNLHCSQEASFSWSYNLDKNRSLQILATFYIYRYVKSAANVVPRSLQTILIIILPSFTSLRERLRQFYPLNHMILFKASLSWRKCSDLRTRLEFWVMLKPIFSVQKNVQLSRGLKYLTNPTVQDSFYINLCMGSAGKAHTRAIHVVSGQVCHWRQPAFENYYLLSWQTYLSLLSLSLLPLSLSYIYGTLSLLLEQLYSYVTLPLSLQLKL